MMKAQKENTVCCYSFVEAKNVGHKEKVEWSLWGANKETEEKGKTFSDVYQT